AGIGSAGGAGVRPGVARAVPAGAPEASPEAGRSGTLAGAGGRELWEAGRRGEAGPGLPAVAGNGAGSSATARPGGVAPRDRPGARIGHGRAVEGRVAPGALRPPGHARVLCPGGTGPGEETFRRVSAVGFLRRGATGPGRAVA